MKNKLKSEIVRWRDGEVVRWRDGNFRLRAKGRERRDIFQNK